MLSGIIANSKSARRYGWIAEQTHTLAVTAQGKGISGQCEGGEREKRMAGVFRQAPPRRLGARLECELARSLSSEQPCLRERCLEDCLHHACEDGLHHLRVSRLSVREMLISHAYSSRDEERAEVLRK